MKKIIILLTLIFGYFVTNSQILNYNIKGTIPSNILGQISIKIGTDTNLYIGVGSIARRIFTERDTTTGLLVTKNNLNLYIEYADTLSKIATKTDISQNTIDTNNYISTHSYVLNNFIKNGGDVRATQDTIGNKSGNGLRIIDGATGIGLFNSFGLTIPTSAAIYNNTYNQTASSNNAQIILSTTGVSAIHNVNDANTAFTVNQENTSATGLVFDAQDGSASVFKVAKDGTLTGKNNFFTINAGGHLGLNTIPFNGQQVRILGSTDLVGATSGQVNFINLINNFAPTSGTAQFAAIEWLDTINQTGGANGISRGIWFHPSIKSAFNWIPFDYTSQDGSIVKFRVDSAGNIFSAGTKGSFWNVNGNSSTGNSLPIIGTLNPSESLLLYSNGNQMMYFSPGQISIDAPLVSGSGSINGSLDIGSGFKFFRAIGDTTALSDWNLIGGNALLSRWRFKGVSEATLDSSGRFILPTGKIQINSTDTNARLTVDGSGGAIQRWSTNGTIEAILASNGILSSFGISNLNTVNNGFVSVSNNGVIVTSNIASSSNWPFTVQQVNAGNSQIVHFLSPGGNTVMFLDTSNVHVSGTLYSSILANLNTAANSQLSMGIGGAALSANIGNSTNIFTLNQLNSLSTGNVQVWENQSTIYASSSLSIPFLAGSLNIANSLDGSGSTFTPKIQTTNTNGIAGFSVMVGNNSSGNARENATLFVDSVHSLSGITQNHANGSGYPFVFRNSTGEAMRINSNDNILLGTTTDNGAKLQVSGATTISGNISALGIGNLATFNNGNISFTNSGILASRNVADASSIFIINNGNSSSTGLLLDLQNVATSVFNVSKTGSVVGGQGAFTFSADGQIGLNTTTSTNQMIRINAGSGVFGATSGTPNFISLLGNFSPTSGTANLATIEWNGTINQTGGANGLVRGIWYHPTLTSVIGGWMPFDYTDPTGGIVKFRIDSAGSIINPSITYSTGGYNLLINNSTTNRYEKISTTSLFGLTSGKLTASGNGTLTTITIAHGLTGITSSSVVIVQSNISASDGIIGCSIDATNITIRYTIAPVLGTNNLSYSYYIK